MYSFHRILCDQMKENAMVGADSTYGRHDHCVLNFNHEAVGKRSVRKVRNKWPGNVKMYLGDRCYEDVDWINQAKNRDKR